MYSTRHANRCYKQDVFSSKVGEQFQFSEQADPEDPVQLASYFLSGKAKTTIFARVLLVKTVDFKCECRDNQSFM